MSGDTEQSGLSLPDGRYLSEEFAELAKDAYELLEKPIEPSTSKTYAIYQTAYTEFCRLGKLDPFQTGSVILHIMARKRAGDSGSTLKTCVAAIRRLAIGLKKPDPTKSEEFRKILRNAAGAIARSRPIRRVDPLTYETLPRLMAVLDEYKDEGMRLRDRALVLIAFGTARRGAELADLNVDDLARYDEGYLIRFRWSKTNKSGTAEYVGLPEFPGDPLCPVAALDAHLEHERIHAGPLFRTKSSVKGRGGNRIRREDISRRLDKIAKAAGLPGVWRSHSGRRGHVTSAEQSGVARSRTRIGTGWKSDAMFSVYADHRDKIAQSPLHEIYGRRSPRLPF